MPTYGPWRQDPDYEQGTTYTADATFDNRYLGDDGGGGYTDNAWSSTPRQVLLADLENALIVAKEGHGEVADFGLDHAVELGYGQDFTVVPEQYQSNWGARYTRAKWRVAPPVDGYSYSPSSSDYSDPDAVAVQFEGAEPVPTYSSGPASIVGVSLDTLSDIITRVGDSTATGGSVDEDVSGTWETVVVVRADGSMAENVVHTIPGLTGTTAPNTLTTPLGSDVDLTALLGPAGWSGALWTETEAVLNPSHMPASGAEVASGTVRYGWLFVRPRVNYLVRPPRYRWVYGDSESYRRVFPRDDGLGASAPRNYPRPKSIQRGNRRAGGYL